MTNIEYLNSLLKEGKIKVLSSTIGAYTERRDLDSFEEVPSSFVEDASEIIPLMTKNSIMIQNEVGNCVYIGAIDKLRRIICPGGNLGYQYMIEVNCSLPKYCYLLYQYDEDTGDCFTDNYIFSNDEQDLSNFILDKICRALNPCFNDLGEQDEEDNTI